MNSKGSFSAIVAVSLVVLIAAIGFTFYSNGVSQKALLEQQNALELRQQWTQERLLLDKAAAKALSASTVFDAGACTVFNFDSAKVGTYFNTVWSNTNDSITCSIPPTGDGSITVSLPVAPATTPYIITFILTCSNAGVSYSGGSVPTITFKKEVRQGPGGCEVWDVQGSEFKDV